MKEKTDKKKANETSQATFERIVEQKLEPPIVIDGPTAGGKTQKIKRPRKSKPKKRIVESLNQSEHREEILNQQRRRSEIFNFFVIKIYILFFFLDIVASFLMEFFATTESLDPEALDSVNFNAPQNFSPEFAPPDPQVLK